MNAFKETSIEIKALLKKEEFDDVEAEWLQGGLQSIVQQLSKYFEKQEKLQNQSRDGETWKLNRTSPLLYLHIYLLAVSAIVLSTIERTFRSAHEIQRWQIKHLLLGIALIFGFFTFFVAEAFIQMTIDFEVLRFTPIAILAGCVPMVVSVRRKSFDLKFRISHLFAYRSIALIASSLYLILMSVIVKQLGQSTESQYIAALTAFAALLALPLLLLSTSFRLRARRWIGRNLFRSRYDYRDQWLRAVEVLHPEPRIEAITEKLADFVEAQLGVKEISTWIRRDRDGRPELHLLSSRGTPGDVKVFEAGRLIDLLENAPEPFEVEALLARTDLGSPGREVFDSLRPSLCAPLVSGSHLVGILLLGERVTGEPPHPEDLEFLKVLAGHAASQLHNAQLLDGQLRAKEAEAFRTLSTFLIHDLKNFTSTLNLITQNAERHGDNPEFLKDAFRSVGQIAGTMNRLCTNLRTLSGGFRVEPRAGDLGALVEAEVASFTRQTGGQVALDIAPLPPVAFDADQIATVLRNILLNAREAAGPDAPIKVTTSRKEGWATIAVRDGGPGIPKDFLERDLFLPFRTTKSGGTGIGLFQSKSIVEAHGGRIEVESEEGKGTTVRIHLRTEREAAPLAGSALLSGRTS
jgi:putative PEP-CTERM system histidine kinase